MVNTLEAFLYVKYTSARHNTTLPRSYMYLRCTEHIVVLIPFTYLYLSIITQLWDLLRAEPVQIYSSILPLLYTHGARLQLRASLQYTRKHMGSYCTARYNLNSLLFQYVLFTLGFTGDTRTLVFLRIREHFDFEVFLNMHACCAHTLYTKH